MFDVNCLRQVKIKMVYIMCKNCISSIIMFIVLFLALYSIRVLNDVHDKVVLLAVTDILTFVRWTLLFFIPLIQVPVYITDLYLTLFVSIFKILHYFQGCSSNSFWQQDKGDCSKDSKTLSGKSGYITVRIRWLCDILQQYGIEGILYFSKLIILFKYISLSDEYIHLKFIKL